jgi:hypothetical protein
MKRKLFEIDSESNLCDTPKRSFSKSLNQASFDWYVKDSEGLWHCKLCRDAKFDNQYAKGHEIPAKTTNHGRHAACEYILLYCFVSLKVILCKYIKNNTLRYAGRNA